jgi:transcriptional regulator with XRE-family HTH domain
MSAGKLSKQLGIDNVELDLYESGTKRVNANLLLRIAKLLGVKPDYFFRDYASGEL